MGVHEVLATFREAGASAILRTDNQECAAIAMRAAVDAGFRVIEFTLTTPGAYELIEEFARDTRLIVGAGTVLDVEQVERARRAGARFIVSPVVDEQVIRAAVASDAVAMPGAHTPTELLAAHRAGAQLQKLFPAPAGGPSWVKAVLGPLPFLRIVPTNGADETNIANWLAAGAFAVGYVATLFESVAVKEKNAAAIQARGRVLLEATRRAAQAQGVS